MKKKTSGEQYCAILNKYNGLQHQVSSLQTDHVRSLLAEIDALGVPGDDPVHASLPDVLGMLYWRYQFEDLPSKKSLARYYEPMPQAAYQIIELFRKYPGFVPAEAKSVYESLLIRPVLSMDTAMLEYLWQIPAVRKSKALCKDELYHAALTDYCYLNLPDWTEFRGSQEQILEQVEKTASAAHARPPVHLRWLFEHGFVDHTQIETSSLADLFSGSSEKDEPVCLRREIKSPGFLIGILPDEDGTLHRWTLHTAMFGHEHQDAAELFHACTETGIRWPFTCTCGIPADAEVYEPVFSARFGDQVSWRILSPKVQYFSFSASQFRDSMKLTLESVLSGMEKERHMGEVSAAPSLTEYPATTGNIRLFRNMLKKLEKTS